MPAFPDTFQAFLDAFVELEPVAATSIGDHRYDGRWPDVTADGRRARLAFIEEWSGVFGALAATDLTRDDAIDRDLVPRSSTRCGSRRPSCGTMRDPLTWVYLLGDGLFPLRP